MTKRAFPMSELSPLDLSRVLSMTIGIGVAESSGDGKMYFDNIRVGTPMPSAQGPTGP